MLFRVLGRVLGGTGAAARCAACLLMAARSHGREHRVADFMQRELSVLLRQEIRDPRVGLVTINEVRVTRDLSYADVFVSQLDVGRIEHEDEDRRTALMDALNGAAGYLRSLLSRSTTLRSVPRLRFVYDEAIENAMHMDRKIRTAMATNLNLTPDEDAAITGALADVDHSRVDGAEVEPSQVTNNQERS